MLRVVALFRVSTDLQANQGASLDAQERRCDELAAAHRWNVVARFRGSESASKAGKDREVLQAALRAIREHDADAVYVHEQSRLTRGDELEVAMLMRELRERQCKVIVCGHVRDLDSIDERFMMRIQSVVDRAEAERIGERSRRGKREKSRQGKWATGSPAFGYRNPAVGELNRGTLQIVPDQAAIVRRIFAMVASGDTVNSVHVRLNAEGVATPRGYGQWGNPTLRRMLTNPVYIGTIEANRWHHDGRRVTKKTPEIVTDGAHEPIIDRITWDRVQTRLAAARWHRGPEPAMLTGILHANGERLVGDSNGRVKFYFCKGVYLRRDHADEVVWDGFTRLIRSPEWIGVIRENLNSDQGEPETAEQHRATIAKLERRLDGLTTMRADAEIGKAEFISRSEAIRAQIQTVRNALAASAVPPAARANELERAAADIRNILRGNVPARSRRRLIESVATRIDARVEREGRAWRIRDLHVGVLTQRQWSWGDRRGSGPLRFRRRSRRFPAGRTSAPD